MSHRRNQKRKKEREIAKMYFEKPLVLFRKALILFLSILFRTPKTRYLRGYYNRVVKRSKSLKVAQDHASIQIDNPNYIPPEDRKIVGPYERLGIMQIPDVSIITHNIKFVK